MNQFDINIHRFANKFSDVYDFLYTYHDKVAGFKEAMTVGDWFIQNHSDFIAEFNRYRQDILSSDREVAAFEFCIMYEIGKSVC